MLQGKLTVALLDKFLAMDFTNNLLRKLSSFKSKAEATGYLLKLSNLEKRIKVNGLEKIPLDCPLLVVSNHPRGVGDGLVLLFCLEAIRPDLKFVVNQLLHEIPHFNELFITRANDGKGRNFSTVRQLLSHLDEDGCICLFPAGTVEHFDWTCLSVKESPWKMNFCRMAQSSSSFGWRYKALTSGGSTMRWHNFLWCDATTARMTLCSDVLFVGFAPQQPLARHFS